MNTVRIWASLLLFITASCSFATRENASTLRFRMYGDGQINRAYIAWNGTESGEVWFDASDGERFVGEYTTIAPEMYRQDLSIFMTRIGRTPYRSTRQFFSSTRSNVQYGLASAAGDRGTTVVCKYIATMNRWTLGETKGQSFNLYCRVSLSIVLLVFPDSIFVWI